MSLPFPAEYRGTLCHPDGIKSCGACCGVYNFKSASASSIGARLANSAQNLKHHPKNDEWAREYAANHAVPDSEKLLDGLRNCHFAGFMDEDDGKPCGRIGCLVHPQGNDGWDGREFGVYDRDTCEDYLCAAHQVLKEAEKWLVINAVEDSYTYGLVITDIRFVRELFERTADINGESVVWSRLARPAAKETARDYFSLKSDWEFGGSDAIFGQLHAGEGLETPRREPPWAQLGLEPDPVDTALTCLGTEVSNLDDLRLARKIVRTKIAAFADAVSQ